MPIAAPLVAVAPGGGVRDRISVPVPSGARDLDLLVAAVYVSGGSGGTTVSTPAGWVLRGSASGLYARTYVYSKVAGSEPSSHTWQTPDSSRLAGVMLAYRGGTGVQLSGTGTATAAGVEAETSFALAGATPRNTDDRDLILACTGSAAFVASVHKPPTGAGWVTLVQEAPSGTQAMLGAVYEQAVPSASTRPSVTLTGSGASDGQSGGAGVRLLIAGNRPPSAPVLTAPDSVNRTEPFDVQVGLVDDAGDTASQSFLRARRVGTTTWTVNLSRQSSLTTVRVPAFTLTAGEWEFQGASRDAGGLPVGDANLVWSGSKVITAGTPPPGPVPVSPTQGATITGSSQVYVVSVPDLDALEWAVYGDAARTELLSFGVNTSGDLRRFTATGLETGTTVFAVFRARLSGLWGAETTTSNPVVFTPPAEPGITATAAKLVPTFGASTDVVMVQATNPTPSGDQPAVAYNEVWRHLTALGGDGIRLRDHALGREVQVPPNGLFTDEWLSSGVNVGYRLCAVGQNGTRRFGPWSDGYVEPPDPDVPVPVASVPSAPAMTLGTPTGTNVPLTTEAGTPITTEAGTGLVL